MAGTPRLGQEESPATYPMSARSAEGGSNLDEAGDRLYRADVKPGDIWSQGDAKGEGALSRKRR